MVIEYADRSKNSAILVSYKKALLRAEVEKLDALIEELKAKSNVQSKAARQPPAANRSRQQKKSGSKAVILPPRKTRAERLYRESNVTLMKSFLHAMFQD